MLFILAIWKVLCTFAASKQLNILYHENFKIVIAQWV